MGNMFSYFKLNKKNRKQASEPKDLSTWIKHGIAEFIGTIILSFMLGGLSIVVTPTTAIESYLGHKVLVGLYAGFIAVGLVLFIFLRWSCDLNPAVTLYRVLNGTNKVGYGAYKIIIQFAAGILTGVIIYGFGSINMTDTGQVNHAFNATKAANTWFSTVPKDDAISLGSVSIFFGELFATICLLWPIFSKNVNDKYRDLMIMFIISLAVYVDLVSGTGSLNPARGLSQQVPGLFWGIQAGGSSSMQDLSMSTLAMEAGTLLSPVFYLLFQGLTDKYVNPFVVKVISFRNFRTNNMRVDK